MRKKKITLLSMIAVTVMVAGANSAFCRDKGERPPARIKVTGPQESLVQKPIPEATLPDEIVCKLANGFYTEQREKLLEKNRECEQLLVDSSGVRSDAYEECETINGMLFENAKTAAQRVCQKCDLSTDECLNIRLSMW